MYLVPCTYRVSTLPVLTHVQKRKYVHRKLYNCPLYGYATWSKVRIGSKLVLRTHLQNVCFWRIVIASTAFSNTRDKDMRQSVSKCINTQCKHASCSRALICSFSSSLKAYVADITSGVKHSHRGYNYSKSQTVKTSKLLNNLHSVLHWIFPLFFCLSFKQTI